MRRALIVSVFVGFLILQSAVAHATAPRILTDITWVTMPSGTDMATAFPERARRAGVSGWSVIECQIDASGRLQACKVLGESPRDYDFAKSALAMARKFRMAPRTKGGEPTEGGYVRFPIVLVNNGAPPPPFNHMVGAPSLLIAIAKSGTPGNFPCPTSALPDRKCAAHDFAWEKQPSMDETAPLIRTSGATSGTSTLRCQIAPDRALTNCATTESDSPRRSAMLDLAKQFKAPLAATDKTPTSGGLVVIEFQWAALREAIDSSVATAISP